jgi:hypothetical protein
LPRIGAAFWRLDRGPRQEFYELLGRADKPRNVSAAAFHRGRRGIVDRNPKGRDQIAPQPVGGTQARKIIPEAEQLARLDG